MFEHQQIPPNAHFTEPNSKILWDKYRLRVATEAIALGSRSSSGRSLISMASSGIGGSNGHVVVEAPPPPPLHLTRVSPETPVLFVIGGLSPKSAQSLSDSAVKMLTANSSSEAVSQAVALARRARQLPWRTHFTYYPKSASFSKIPNPVLAPKVSPPVIMVFSGQGPQHIHMGRSLFRVSQVFRDSISELDGIYECITGASLIKTTSLFDGEESTLSGVWPTEITLPALTMVQIALFDLLQSVGVKPNFLMGHSAGETALVYASGAGSKAMALEIAILKAEGIKVAEQVGGGMLSLGCDQESVSRIVAKVKEKMNGVLDIACYNSPDAFVVSGDVKLVDEALVLAQKESIFARKLRNSTPSHSAMMDICKEKYLEVMVDVFSRFPRPCKPVVPTFSSVAGQEEMISEFTPEYFWQNLRRPVHFQQAIETAIDENPDAIFIEISPHPVLSSYILASTQKDAFCPMRREKDVSALNADLVAFTEIIASLSVSINSIDLTMLYGRASRNQAYSIPYPFTTRHFPLRIDGPRSASSTNSETSALRINMNAKLFPDLAQHIINGEKIVPAAAFLDMVSELCCLQDVAGLNLTKPHSRCCKRAHGYCGTLNSMLYCLSSPILSLRSEENQTTTSGA